MRLFFVSRISQTRFYFKVSTFVPCWTIMCLGLTHFHKPESSLLLAHPKRTPFASTRDHARPTDRVASRSSAQLPWLGCGDCCPPTIRSLFLQVSSMAFPC